MAAQIYHSVGKRKSAIARIYMKSGSGQITVNSRPSTEYFTDFYQRNLWVPLKALEAAQKYDIAINVAGGGSSAQSEACMYGIAKALSFVSEKNRPILKKMRLLTRDSRVVERKMYGHKKARRSFQFSKR